MTAATDRQAAQEHWVASPPPRAPFRRSCRRDEHCELACPPVNSGPPGCATTCVCLAARLFVCPCICLYCASSPR
jgi:hypothetical protein